MGIGHGRDEILFFYKLAHKFFPSTLCPFPSHPYKLINMIDTD